MVETLTKLCWLVVIYNKKGVQQGGKGKVLFAPQNKGVCVTTNVNKLETIL